MRMSARSWALFIAFVLAAATPAHAEDIEWSADLDQAWDVATQDQCPILVYITTSNCPHCIRMNQKTFADPQLASEINQTCVPVKIDAQRHADFVKANQITAFPALLVVAPDKRLLDHAKGFQTPAQIRERLETAQRILIAERQKSSRRR
jgi:thioredoxin-like negative regulator of GroEL